MPDDDDQLGDDTPGDSSGGGDGADDFFHHARPDVPGFRLIRCLGVGSQGEVYLAEREGAPAGSSPVAVKLFNHTAVSRGGWRFEQERRILRGLKHPNIVKLLDHGETPDGRPFLVVQYIEGSSLKSLLRSHRSRETHRVPTSPRLDDQREIAAFFQRICEIVGDAHLAGVIHRDLKPSNIVVDRAGAPYVLDFGLARTAFDDEWRAQRSATGGPVGTLAYMSPEQARELRDLTPASDVYSLGVMLYETLAAGRFPYDVSASDYEVLGHIINRPPRPLGAQRGSAPHQPGAPIDPVLEAVVMHALRKDPAERYKSAGELGRDLEAYLAGRETLAVRGGSGVVLPRLRARALGAVGGVAVLAAIVVLSMGLLVPRLQRFGGEWGLDESGTLTQTAHDRRHMMILFGGPNWSEYDFTFEARALGPKQGFGAVVHARDNRTFREFIYGNYTNKGHDIASTVEGKFQENRRQFVWGKIEFNRWYKVRIRVRGSDVACFVDDELVVQHDDPAFSRGRIGFTCWGTAAEYRNIRVVSPQGDELWSGMPDGLPAVPPAKK